MTVKMTHPQAKKPIEVGEQYVAMYESQGWQTAEQKAASASSSDPSKGKS